MPSSGCVLSYLFPFLLLINMKTVAMMHSFFPLSSLWIRMDYEIVLMKKYPLHGLLFLWKHRFTFLLNTLDPGGKAWRSVRPWSARTEHPRLCSRWHLQPLLLPGTLLAQAQSQGTLRPPCSRVWWHLSLDFHRQGKRLNKSVLCAACADMREIFTRNELFAYLLHNP